MTWVWLSLAAALLQNVRTAAQKRLSDPLSTGAAASVRFVFGLPFAACWLLFLARGAEAWPVPDLRFAAFLISGSVAQILGTSLLLAAFRHRSFAVGQTFSKTEGIQTVLIGFLLLGDRVSALAMVGIALTVAGVLVTSMARQGSGVGLAASARWRAALFGLASGAAFAFSAVGYRGAALALGEQDYLLRAALTLVCALAVQSVLCLLWLRLREPEQLSRIILHWRPALLAGATGAAASACWFTAFTLVAAAYVKAVGSVELLLAVATSWLFFGERPAGVELVGIGLVGAGVVLTILAG